MYRHDERLELKRGKPAAKVVLESRCFGTMLTTTWRGVHRLAKPTDVSRRSALPPRAAWGHACGRACSLARTESLARVETTTTVRLDKAPAHLYFSHGACLRSDPPAKDLGA